MNQQTKQPQLQRVHAMGQERQADRHPMALQTTSNPFAFLATERPSPSPNPIGPSSVPTLCVQISFFFFRFDPFLLFLLISLDLCSFSLNPAWLPSCAMVMADSTVASASAVGAMPSIPSSSSQPLLQKDSGARSVGLLYIALRASAVGSVHWQTNKPPNSRFVVAPMSSSLRWFTRYQATSSK